MIDALGLIDLVERQLISGERDGGPTKIVIMRRRYDADVDQVWDACTHAERLPRWLLPVSRGPAVRRSLPVRGQRRRRGSAAGHRGRRPDRGRIHRRVVSRSG